MYINIQRSSITNIQTIPPLYPMLTSQNPTRRTWGPMCQGLEHLPCKLRSWVCLRHPPGHTNLEAEIQISGSVVLQEQPCKNVILDKWLLSQQLEQGASLWSAQNACHYALHTAVACVACTALLSMCFPEQAGHSSRPETAWYFDFTLLHLEQGWTSSRWGADG